MARTAKVNITALRPSSSHPASRSCGNRRRYEIATQQLLAHVPLAAHLRRVLDDRPSHAAPASRYRDELEDFVSPDYADQTLRAVTNWSRYAESFSYDEGADRFSLEDAI